ncbi:MAG: ATP-binding protein [Candidatus Uhrbacteria bacterium]
MSLLLDPINSLLIITAGLNLTLGAIIFVYGRNKEMNIVYSLNIIAIISWIVAMFIFRSAPAETSIFWCTVLYTTPTFIASSFLYFTYIFPAQRDETAPIKMLLIFCINVLIVFMVIKPDFMITDVNIRHGLEKEIIFTKAYWFYFLYTAGFFSFGFYRLFKKYFKSTGTERLQILYLSSGYSIAANLAFATNLIMPWVGYFFLNWLGQVLTVIMVGCTAYSIVQFRLMDIRIVVRKTFIYACLAIFTYITFYVVISGYIYLFGSVHTLGAYLISPFVAIIYVFILQHVHQSLNAFANKHLFASLYNYHETIKKLSEELNYYIDLKKISNLLVHTFRKTMHVDRAGIALINQNVKPSQYEIVNLLGFNRRDSVSFVQNKSMTEYLMKTKRSLVSDELAIMIRNNRQGKRTDELKKLYQHLEMNEVAVCSPLMSGKKIIGFVFLGSKISKDAYTQEDLELINTVSKQAGVAIENAVLYRQIQDFSKTLQDKVDQQTKSLKELLEMKADFLRVVNHQLNTPLSVMKGYFSMMNDGIYTTKKALPLIKIGLERITSTVADFWGAYELEGERMRMNPQKTDFSEIVNKLISEKQKMKLAIERNLIISAQKTKFSIPLVWCDYKKVSHVISNLLDNAVQYTRQGNITVSYELTDDDRLKVNVKDTGVGISAREKEKMFKKFSRGDKATDLRPDGSGLGLFIAKKIVEGNNGEISLYSAGKDKGTTFSFTIPIYKNQKSTKEKEGGASRKKIVIFGQK